MTACKLYLIVSAVLVLISDSFFPVFRTSYSLWLVPILFVGFFLALVIIQLIVLGLMIICTNIKKPTKGENFFRLFVKHSLPIIVFLARVKIRFEGIEKLPDDKNILFVCNHQFDFDPVIILSAFPDSKISFIGKKDIIDEMKLATKIMHRLSCLFIDRENDREAAKTIISAIKMLKNSDNSIGLFPEGYCSKTGELLPIRNGSLKIALKSKVPIAVCTLNNTRQIPKNMFRRKTVVDFRLVDVIMPETYEDMTTSELGQIIYNEMSASLEEIKNEQYKH